VPGALTPSQSSYVALRSRLCAACVQPRSVLHFFCFRAVLPHLVGADRQQGMGGCGDHCKFRNSPLKSIRVLRLLLLFPQAAPSSLSVFFVSQRSPPQGVRGGDNQTSKGSAALALCERFMTSRVELPAVDHRTGFSPPPSLSTRASAIRKTLGLQHSISSWSSQRWVSQLTVHPRPTSTTFEGAKSAASSPLRRPP